MFCLLYCVKYLITQSVLAFFVVINFYLFKCFSSLLCEIVFQLFIFICLNNSRSFLGSSSSLLLGLLGLFYVLNTYVLDFFTFCIFCTFFDFLLCFFLSFYSFLFEFSQEFCCCFFFVNFALTFALRLIKCVYLIRSS